MKNIPGEQKFAVCSQFLQAWYARGKYEWHIAFNYQEFV